VGSAAGTLIVVNARLWQGTAANPGNRHIRFLEADFVRADDDVM
jgi:hypothetical protein